MVIAHVRISLALALSILGSGAYAQEAETPFGGGPIVHASPGLGWGVTAYGLSGQAVAMSSMAEGPDTGLNQARSGKGRAGRGGRGSGGHGGGGGGRGAGGHGGGGRSGRN